MKKAILFLLLQTVQTVLFAQEYFPEGTKWTEIRLDTLKYDSWYSKEGEEYLPNFETVEYYVKGEYTPTIWGGNNQHKYTCVYTNGPEWIDSLTLLIRENVTEFDTHIGATTPNLAEVFALPGEAYQMEWHIGQGLYYRGIIASNVTGAFTAPQLYGIIEEIKEGNFGGGSPLKYADLDGIRIIHGIGVTEWKNGECLFGQIKPYDYSFYDKEELPKERHYRSMLVHFERHGEVLYNVWPEKQEIYKSFLEEGKAWKYHYHSSNDKVYDVFLAVKGDTLIDDTIYKKIVNVESGSCDYVMREDGGKVYCRYQNGKESIVYDFGLNVGDSFNTSDVKATVVAVDTITANGRTFRALDVREDNSTQPNWWVEGIGSMSYLTSSFRYPGNNYNFLQCQLGEDILFSQEDFRTLDIPSLTVGSNRAYDSGIYDLQGRRLNSKPQHGIYIKDRKKYVK